jgi:hypothetical protein
MSANNKLLIYQQNDKYCISDDGFVVGIKEGYDTLEEAISAANEYMSENIVEYGLDMEINKKRNTKLDSFVKYCRNNPELRFWQALRNWSGSNFIIKSTHYDPQMFNHKWCEKNKVETQDTFYC